MRRFQALLIIIILSSSVSVLAGGTKATEFKYKEARAAVRGYGEAVKKAERNYAAALRQAERDYLVGLEAALKAAMERGDLEESNKIDAAIKGIESASKPKASSPIATPSATQEPNLSTALLGSWRYPNGTTLTFFADGTYTRSWDKKAKPGTWKHLGGKKFQVGKDIVTLSEDLKSFPNPNAKARGQIIRKVTPIALPADASRR